MFDYYVDSIEECILKLQDMGLTLNEIKSVNGNVTNESYEELLNYTINLLNEFQVFTKKIQELI